MALTPEQERAASIALGQSFNADQKKNLMVAFAAVQDGSSGLPPAGAGTLGGVLLGAAVADSVDDTDVVAQLNALLAALRASGAIDTGA